jgi:hypothetical protein
MSWNGWERAIVIDPWTTVWLTLALNLSTVACIVLHGGLVYIFGVNIEVGRYL